jgi:hypothetical protein
VVQPVETTVHAHENVLKNVVDVPRATNGRSFVATSLHGTEASIIRSIPIHSTRPFSAPRRASIVADAMNLLTPGIH